jgi:hypothetical protein
MFIDITKELYVRDKADNEIYKVTALFFPLGKPSGKDITIDCDNSDEWRSIEDVELIPNV